MTKPFYALVKIIEGYAYARNGNTHNPTPRVHWEIWEGRQIGNEPRMAFRRIDRANKMKDLKADYPGCVRWKLLDKICGSVVKVAHDLQTNREANLR